MHLLKKLENRIFNNNFSNLKISNDASDAIEKISDGMLGIINSHANPHEGTFALVCIGTDRSTGDCLGPLIGSKLLESNQNFFKLFGTLDEPVHAANLTETLEIINNTYTNPTVIAVDACLGNLDSIGQINLNLGPIKPGAGVNKDLPPIGDFHITGIVNVGGFMEYFVLQNTRLSLVVKMANNISAGILAGIFKFKNR